MSAKQGIIREEAEVRCGGASQLDRAVANGSVLQRDHKGQALFFFPSVRLGQRQLATSSQHLQRGKQTTDEGFTKTQTLMRSLGWVIKSGEAGQKKKT